QYWFLSGFTAKLAGTEIGVTEPQPTFSTCFGAPFMPQPPERYARIPPETPGALRAYVRGQGGGACCDGLARQPRLDRRAVRAGAPDADQGDACAARRRAVGIARRRGDARRPDLRYPGAARGARRRHEASRPALDLGRRRSLRRKGGRARGDVPRELPEALRRGRRPGCDRGRPALTRVPIGIEPLARRALTSRGFRSIR